MADQADVENVLVTLAAKALYPNGLGSPSLPGPDCRIYRGWPNSSALNADLAAGRINVTVFPQGEAGNNTTRYLQRWYSLQGQPTLTATVSGTSVTIGGTTNMGQILGILVNDASYAYAIIAGDTPETVAACLATAIRADWIVNLSGNSLTIPGASRVLARVVVEAVGMQEVRRQEQGFRITCWCPTPTARDTVASAIDLLLTGFRFISLEDNSHGRLQYKGTLVFDQSQDALLYRRDLLYNVEYCTTISEIEPSMLFGNLIVNAGTFIA